MTVLIEKYTHNQANVKSKIVENESGEKSMFMEGIFVQGDVKNANQRMYPTSEIAKAVNQFNKELKKDIRC
jgi:hypothetical protein